MELSLFTVRNDLNLEMIGSPLITVLKHKRIFANDHTSMLTTVHYHCYVLIFTARSVA